MQFNESGDTRERIRFALFPRRTATGWVWLRRYLAREEFVVLPGEDGRWRVVSAHRIKRQPTA